MTKEFQKRILSSLFLIPLCFFFIFKGSYFFLLFLTICLIITSYEWHMMSKFKKYYHIGLIFLFFSFYCAYSLRSKFDDQGLIIFLFVIIICISTDIGGYIFGKILKGPKLTRISPNKTFSGFFGGFFLAVTTIYFLTNFMNHDNLFEDNFDIEIFLTIILISLVSQIGDIIVSYFKRLSKIKNTGKIIPGHGGILDRIDGMIFAFPFSYLLFLFFNII